MNPLNAPVRPPTRIVPPFMVDTGTAAHVALAHEVAAANRRAEGGSRVLLDDHGAGHHVLRTGPSDPAGDAHVGAVDEPDAEVAEAALEVELQAIQDPDADGMLGAGILHDDGAVAFAHEVPDLQIDRLRVHVGDIDLGPLVEVDLEGPGIGDSSPPPRGGRRPAGYGPPAAPYASPSHRMRAPDLALPYAAPPPRTGHTCRSRAGICS